MRNIIASYQKDNLCDFLEKWLDLDKGLSAKERNKSQDSDMKMTVTELASYQKPYFLSCGGVVQSSWQRRMFEE